MIKKVKNILSLKIFFIIFFNLFFCFYILELFARYYVSKSHDGVIWLKSPTPNYERHEKYGWFSIPNLSYEKIDSCFGSGTVSYNSDGLRADSFTKREDYDVVVIILGDSTVQAYQIPDGRHMSAILQEKLKRKFKNPYVVGLGVGGYGTAQQLQILKDFYQKFRPNYIFHLWDKNDFENNSYEWEKVIGSGHNLQIPRPYYNISSDKFEIKNPMPLYLGSHFTYFKISKKINKTINNLFVETNGLKKVKAESLKLTKTLIEKIKQTAPESRMFGMYFSYAKAGISNIYNELNIPTIELPNMDDKRCLPIDYHINPAGHQMVVKAMLKKIIY